MTNQRALAWTSTVLWAGVIFGLSSIPSLSSDLGTWDLVLRKLGHFAEFGILSGLLYWATRRPLLSLALASAYAATDEIHQAFVSGRQGSPLDWAIDTAGAALGVVVAAEILRRRAAGTARTAAE